MRKKFEFLSKQEEAALSKEQLIEYYRKVQDYYKTAPLNKTYLNFVKSFRGKLLEEAAKMKDFEIVYLNDVEVPEGGYILATNHKGFNDIPALLEIMGKDEPINILMATDNPFPLKTKILLFLMGAIKFSRSDKREKEKGFERASAMGAQGYLPAYYPEAVNNFTDSTPLYHFWRGYIRNAKNSNLPIIQIATFDRDGKMYVMCGKPFHVNAYDNEDIAATILRDEMFSMLWEMKQRFPEITREQAMAEYEPRNLTKDGLTFRPEYEEQFLYRPVTPYSPTGERELTEDEVYSYERNIKIASKITEDMEMKPEDCQDFDIKTAQNETKAARVARAMAYLEQVGTNEFNGPVRTIKRKM